MVLAQLRFSSFRLPPFQSPSTSFVQKKKDEVLFVFWSKLLQICMVRVVVCVLNKKKMREKTISNIRKGNAMGFPLRHRIIHLVNWLIRLFIQFILLNFIPFYKRTQLQQRNCFVLVNTVCHNDGPSRNSKKGPNYDQLRRSKYE